MSTQKPRPGEAVLVLHYAEMQSLADVHQEMAGESIRRGEHEAHDRHECRAFELRQLAAKARAAADEDVAN